MVFLDIDIFKLAEGFRQVLRYKPHNALQQTLCLPFPSPSRQFAIGQYTAIGYEQQCVECTIDHVSSPIARYSATSSYLGGPDPV